MSSRPFLIVSITLLTVVAGLSCDSDRGLGPARGNQFSEKDQAEAKLAAIWLSGELTAPDSTYRRILVGLKSLRDTYEFHIPEVSIRFKFPAEPSRIDVMLTDSAALEFRNGAYIEWDSLNTLFKLTRLDTVDIFEGWHQVNLWFEGLQHPRVIANQYQELDGIGYAMHLGYVGSWSNTCPWITDGKLTFLVVSSWGDCPAGCMYSRYIYFREDKGGIRFIGESAILGPGWNPPYWWEEASVGYRAYETDLWPGL